MKKKKTSRGFDYSEFVDNNGVRCSLQKSSSAMEDKIWLGVMDTNPIILCQDAKRLGLPMKDTVGWQPYYVPSEVMFNDRMHLTRKQVKELLPHLENFVKTGEL